MVVRPVETELLTEGNVGLTRGEDVVVPEPEAVELGELVVLVPFEDVFVVVDEDGTLVLDVPKYVIVCVEVTVTYVTPQTAASTRLVRSDMSMYEHKENTYTQLKILVVWR